MAIEDTRDWANTEPANIYRIGRGITAFSVTYTDNML